MKLVRETKNNGDNTIAVTATAVRVPVVGGHSEAVNAEFTNDFDVNDVKYFASYRWSSSSRQYRHVYVSNAFVRRRKGCRFVGRIRRD
jgi:aspartate-semialdehyde dehydrogenase